MRYYNIVISDPSSNKTVRQYTSQLNGQNLPNALNVELDLFAYTYATPAGGSYVRIWGIPIADIVQAQQFVGLNITVSGGMQKGLPLANPAQSGPLVIGQVYQALGNWVDTDMTLDLFVRPHVGTVAAPLNYIVSWQKGQTLATAIQNTLQTALNTTGAKYTFSININPNLLVAYDQQGYYQSMEELAQWVKQKSKAIIDPTGADKYPGVDILINQNKVVVTDQSTQTTPKVIKFTDLIGQPTWLDGLQISIKTVMRADISVGDFVSLPFTVATATPGSIIGTPQRNSLTFTGTFFVQVARHVGNFRQADAASWVSVFNAAAQIKSS